MFWWSPERSSWVKAPGFWRVPFEKGFRLLFGEKFKLLKPQCELVFKPMLPRESPSFSCDLQLFSI